MQDAYAVYQFMDEFGQLSEFDQLSAQLDQLLTVTLTLLDSVEVNRQTIIQGQMSGIHADMQQALVHFAQYGQTKTRPSACLPLSTPFQHWRT
jgi:hypothetical protein